MKTETKNEIPEIETIEIYGSKIAPAIGAAIEWETSKGLRYGILSAGDAPVDSGYRGSQFRLSTPHLEPMIPTLPVDVKVTARTMQLRNGGDLYVRVKITFIGDCEPDSHLSGWMLINKTTQKRD